jgi:hypothetical protein
VFEIVLARVSRYVFLDLGQDAWFQDIMIKVARYTRNIRTSAVATDGGNPTTLETFDLKHGTI